MRDDPLVIARRFTEANGADVRLVGGPVCPNIYTVLSGFLQIEKHPTAEDAEDSGAAQDSKYAI